MRNLQVVRANRRMALASSITTKTLPSNDLFEPIAQTFDDKLLGDLQDSALELYSGNDDKSHSEIDAYLAPRLHASLRLPRALAARDDLWSWIASVPLRGFVDHRWPINPERPSAWRFVNSNLLRNGAARLWWAAEMLRDGPDYKLAVNPLKQVYAFQFVSELKYSWHKECSRAFARVFLDSKLSADDTKELSKRLNVYLKSRVLELSDYDDPLSVSSKDTVWLNHQPKLSEVTCSIGELVGPNDGFSRQALEEELYTWLTDIAKKIPKTVAK
jgi:hypothetical protein